MNHPSAGGKCMSAFHAEFLDWRHGDWGGRILWNAQISTLGCLLPPASPAQDTWESTCRVSGYQKWGLAACSLKAKKEASFVERKVCFILDADNQGMMDSCPQAGSLPTPSLPVSGQELYIVRERGLHAETAQSALLVVLKLVMWWSDQRHRHVSSTVYPQFQAGSVCSHFFEAIPWNCGSLCQGYSLVIKVVSLSTWWVV